MASIDTIFTVTRTYRHIGRYNQILQILIRYGFGYVLDSWRLHVPRSLRELWQRRRPEDLADVPETMPERARLVLIELGPTFVKLGQVLSARPDLIPIEYAREFTKLQDRVPSFPFAEVREIIHEELGAQLEDFFAEFDQEPVAAASIAQGHRARLLDGTEVFVKVQRPNIQKNIAIDLEVLGYLANQLEQHSEELGFLRPTRIVDEFARSLSAELDFTIELSNQQRFSRQFSKRAGVRVPKVFQDLSTRRLLVMEYIHGIKASEIDALRAGGYDLEKISDLGADLVLEQFFDHGFFHADPHPGNMFILPGNVICYVDFGMMGWITPSERDDFANLLVEVLAGHYQPAVHYLLRLTHCDGEPDMGELERDLEMLVSRYFHGNIAQFDVGAALQDLYSVCRRQGLSIKSPIYIMLRALGFVEELGRRMNPQFEIVKHLQPFATRWMLRRYNPMRLAHSSISVADDWLALAKELPQNYRQVLRQLLHGRLKLRHQFESVDATLRSLDRICNRLAASIVLGGIVVGSAIVIHSDRGPKLLDAPVMGIVGFVFSAFLGFWLLWSIIRSGRM
ncbi:MAG: ABC1 kinase family protein [Lentisphaeria bacterium]|jgi:ubiquinone biosynthesis protein